jgi:uncharacterized protein
MTDAMTTLPALFDADTAVQDTRRWLERAVIGLNLCPFAKAVHVKGQVHYAVSLATTSDGVLLDLIEELKSLKSHVSIERDTTLLIVPLAFADFLDFNDFLGRADTALARQGLEGEFQLASFHPRYQFADTAADDITNATNRAPYPTLHLLREASIDRAVASFPEAEAIFEVNMATLERLGPAGWAALDVGPTARPPQPDAAA